MFCWEWFFFFFLHIFCCCCYCHYMLSSPHIMHTSLRLAHETWFGECVVIFEPLIMSQSSYSYFWLFQCFCRALHHINLIKMSNKEPEILWHNIYCTQCFGVETCSNIRWILSAELNKSHWRKSTIIEPHRNWLPLEQHNAMTLCIFWNFNNHYTKTITFATKAFKFKWEIYIFASTITLLKMCLHRWFSTIYGISMRDNIFYHTSKRIMQIMSEYNAPEQHSPNFKPWMWNYKESVISIHLLLAISDWMRNI